MKMVALSCLLVFLHSTALSQISIFPYSTDFARTILDDPNSTEARATLEAIIGRDVQAWSTILDGMDAGSGVLDDLQIDNTMAIGQAPVASTALEIDADALTTANPIGMRFKGTLPVTATGSFNAFTTLPNLVNDTFAMTNFFHYNLSNVTLLGGTPTVGTQTGYHTNDLTSGNTNYGFRGEVSAGANKWNLYMDGTAANYLAGGGQFGSDSHNINITSTGALTTTGVGYVSGVSSFDVRDYGAGIGESLATNTTAFQSAIDAAEAANGGIVKVPIGSFHVGSLNIEGENVIIEGSAPGYDYGSTKSSSVLYVNDGEATYLLRIHRLAAYSGLKQINLRSNGALNSSPPCVATTDGVEYGVFIEVGTSIMRDVSVNKFQYGVVLAQAGNSNVFRDCGFHWNTRCGFANTIGSAAAYAVHHPNISVPAGYIPTTIFSMDNCLMRRNGWGMILRQGGGVFHNTLIESNHFGGLMAYTNTGTGVGGTFTGQFYVENNFIGTGAGADGYTITQNNMLKLSNPSTFIDWTDATDSKYQIYFMAEDAGTTYGPIITINGLAMVISGNQKAGYLKSSYKCRFIHGAYTGGASSDWTFSDGAGHNSTATLFKYFSGSLPTDLGNRGTIITLETSATDGGSGQGGGLTATIGRFRGLAGDVNDLVAEDPNFTGTTVTEIFQGGTDANNVTVSAEGAFSLTGDARVQKEVVLSLDGIGKGATAPTLTRLASSIGYAFGIGDDGYMQIEVPADWAAGTGIEFYIHCYNTEAYATNSGEVQWQGIWYAVPEDGSEAIDGATHNGTLDSGDINLATTAKGLQEVEIGEISGASLAQHDVITILISRVAIDGGNNPTAGEPVIIQAEIEYTSDKLGLAL